MREISVLDATLRDGGCVIDFNFGIEYMNQILKSLEESGVDYIELGYLDGQKGSESGRTMFINETVIHESFLKSKNDRTMYLAMMDFGKYDVHKLSNRTPFGIDGIRVAFHKKDWEKALEDARVIKDKGYEVFIQPMITMRYSDAELIDLIKRVNDTLPDATAFYLVDSFGEMRMGDVDRMVFLINHNLHSDIAIGFHSHNNLQLSYANAMALMRFSMDRKLIIDSSVMGMGKGAGNLNTELLMEHLNLYYYKQYGIKPLLRVIDEVIGVLHSSTPWGYAVEYYLSSRYGCSPSYASYFYRKNRLTIEDISSLLSQISDEKKSSFDQNYAESIYVQYNRFPSHDDKDSVEKIRESFCGKTVLVMAPGKSVLDKAELVSSIKDRSDVSIALNCVDFDTDFILITRNGVLDRRSDFQGIVIHTSNVRIEKKEGDSISYMIDYFTWAEMDEKLQDSAGVIGLKLVASMNPKKITVIGMDGYRDNIDDNYYDPTMRRKFTKEEIYENNLFLQKFLEKIRKKTEIEFVTSTMYVQS